jgi:hypothetical protein
MCRRRCCSIRRRRKGWLDLADALRGFAGSRIRVGLLALPLCGAAVTFFAAAKKATKETALPIQSASCRPRHRRLAEWPGSSECPHKTRAAWIAHGLSNRVARVAGSARNSSSPLRGRWVNRVCVCFCVSLFSLVSLAYPTAARSAVPKLFRAEPARSNA